MSASTTLRTPPPGNQIIQLWLPLAQRGHAKAQYILGRLHAEGKGIERNFWKAHMWLLRSAEQGNGDAQMYLGIMYARGYGVRQDHRKSARWLQLGANQGVVKAQFYLSRMYARGLGVPRSYVYAYMWAMLAATGGRRSAGTHYANNENIRAAALNTLQIYARAMSSEEASAAIRMAKRWRERNYVTVSSAL